jgi:hypothetical protein
MADVLSAICFYGSAGSTSRALFGGHRGLLLLQTGDAGRRSLMCIIIREASGGRIYRALRSLGKIRS